MKAVPKGQLFYLQSVKIVTLINMHARVSFLYGAPLQLLINSKIK